MSEYKYIGKRVKRADGYEKVTGSLKFGADINMPGQLVGKCLHSPVAHAKIKRLNVSKAEKYPGVVCVVTGKEYPGLCGAYLNDSHIYAIDRVLFVGDIVAAVAAETDEIAEEALDLIEVEYEELPTILSAEESLKEGATLIHPNLGSYKWIKGFTFPVPGTNISNHFRLRQGDVEKGFADADQIFEDTFYVPMMQHTPMESHTTVAEVVAGNKITLYCNTQNPFTTRKMISEAFDIPYNKITLNGTGVGGGFGSKSVAKTELYAIPLAIKAKRPVKLVFDRTEEFINTFVRQALTMKLKTGVMNNGKMVAREIECLWEGGAFNDYGVSIARSGGYASAGPYKIPHVKIDSICCYSNKASGGAFRGFGVPETSSCQEQQIDMIAERLGIEANAMRRMNFYSEGDTHCTGMKLHSVGSTECLNKVEKLFSESKLDTNDPGKVYGRGDAFIHKFTAHTVACSAILKVNEDSTLTLSYALTEIGQGNRTALAQIAAEVMDVEPDIIETTYFNSDFTPYGWNTAASKGTFFDGNAVLLAAEDAKKQLIDLAAIRFEAEVDSIVFKEGKLYPEGREELAQTFGEISMGGRYPLPVLGYGVYTVTDGTGLDEMTGQGERCSAFWMFGGQGAEVYVDTETGEIELARMVASHDGGTIINPMLAEGQIEGSVAQGMGSALFEEMVYDDKGRLLNDSFTDYRLPTTLDCPGVMDMDLVETTPHRDGPFGAKGLGEPAMAPVAPAIANAIYNACGVRLGVIPITSERVWRALKEKEANN